MHEVVIKGMKSCDDGVKSRGTYLQMTSPEVYSRRFSEFVRHFHSDDFTDTPQLRRRLKYTSTFRSELAKLNKRRESRPTGAEPTKRQRKKVTRTGSEQTLFPPISVTSPDGGKSPVTSNVQTARSGMSSPKDDHPSGTDKHDSNKKSRNTKNLLVDKEAVRLSPIALSERRTKYDSKCEKHVTLTPRGSIPKISSKAGQADLAQKQERSNSLTDSNTKPEKSHRVRSKGRKGKSKDDPFSVRHHYHSSKEEPFSVRQKIEQYRKWHEEQYLQKLKPLRQDVDANHKADGDKHMPEKEHNDMIDLSKVLEEKACTSAHDDTEQSNDRVPMDVSETEDSFHERVRRVKSGRTWKTWRDVNESDAYSDVKKYIEDNELMTTEKEGWIQDWLTQVESALRPNDCVIDEPESVVVDLT